MINSHKVGQFVKHIHTKKQGKIIKVDDKPGKTNESTVKWSDGETTNVKNHMLQLDNTHQIKEDNTLNGIIKNDENTNNYTPLEQFLKLHAIKKAPENGELGFNDSPGVTKTYTGPGSYAQAPDDASNQEYEDDNSMGYNDGEIQAAKKAARNAILDMWKNKTDG